MEGMELKIPYTISITLGRTINTGNYESLRVTVGLSAPVKNFKNIEKVGKVLAEKVEEMLNEKIEELLEKYGKSKVDEAEIVELIDLEEE